MRRGTRHLGTMGGRGGMVALLVLALIPLFAGCATVAEQRKLRYEVAKLKVAQASGEGADVADLRTEMDSLRESMAKLSGRMDVIQHQAQEALEEAKAARQQAASLAAANGPPRGSAPGQAPGASSPGGASVGSPAGASPQTEAATPPAPTQELKDYRSAYDAWTHGDAKACIDRFSQFLQTYPASDLADDAAYWLADCYFKQGDYKTAILRFDDVVSRYPKSDKAPDALYRQGEALLKLGPGYSRAAEKAFERVIHEYPGSKRAAEAQRRLATLRAG